MTPNTSPAITEWTAMMTYSDIDAAFIRPQFLPNWVVLLCSGSTSADRFSREPRGMLRVGEHVDRCQDDQDRCSQRSRNWAIDHAQFLVRFGKKVARTGPKEDAARRGIKARAPLGSSDEQRAEAANNHGNKNDCSADL
jgi:hypothetical protein